MLIFKPDTMLRWHRELVRRKWTLHQKRKPGRPRLSSELEELIIRLANENHRWGYDKIHGELLKLGFAVSPTSVRNVLKRHQISPAPQRSSLSWRSFLGHNKDQILACDFFTIETISLKTLYVLFFIELGSRRVHFAGCSAHPNSLWVTQQARQLVWQLENAPHSKRFLIHDRDTKFSKSFGTVFVSEKIKIIRTPYRAPRANAFAERWVRSVREECLDHILIINESHLYRVLNEYVDTCNRSRPHQGISQNFPVSNARHNNEGSICRRKILGGIIHDYFRQPSSPVLTVGRGFCTIQVYKTAVISILHTVNPDFTTGC